MWRWIGGDTPTTVSRSESPKYQPGARRRKQTLLSGGNGRACPHRKTDLVIMIDEILNAQWLQHLQILIKQDHH